MDPNALDVSLFPEIIPNIRDVYYKAYRQTFRMFQQIWH